jgi:pSer/pThr/pTyr-binding forkhead associated (FHA) protein
MDVQMKVLQGKPHGHCLRFTKGEFIFGRGPECHIRPNSDWVSRQHCLLRVQDDEVSLRDLGSSNGTLVNGQLVTEERRLYDGDTVQLGPLVLQIVISDAATLADRDMVHDTLHEFPKSDTISKGDTRHFDTQG